MIKIRCNGFFFPLAGKSFLCSTIGCDGSFSSMQQLMDHMRRHHKPNYFFQCVFYGLGNLNVMMIFFLFGSGPTFLNSNLQM